MSDGKDVSTDSGGPVEEDKLEARLQRLEEILGQLEADEVALDRALALFEEGVRLVRQSEEMLSQSMLRVEEVLADGSTRVFDEEEDA